MGRLLVASHWFVVVYEHYAANPASESFAIMGRLARLPGLAGVAPGGRGYRGIRRPGWRCRPWRGRGWLEKCGGAPRPLSGYGPEYGAGEALGPLPVVMEQPEP